jgi:hypothetical protein
MRPYGLHPGPERIPDSAYLSSIRFRGTIDARLKMNSLRRLLALLMVAALLFAAFAPVPDAQSAAILIPLFLFFGCLTAVSLRRVFERCDLPSSPFCSAFASRAPPTR